MPSSDTIPASLVSLGREAVEAVAAMGDPASFRGVALLNEARDAIFKPLPSYEAAKDAISAVPLVAERYGSRDAAGDRLTLQFIYQLFPRSSTLHVGEDMRRLWRRFIAELKVPVWVYRGVANLRNFAVEQNVPDPLQLEEGVTIRGRSFDALRSLGFNDFTLDALVDDVSRGRGASSYVICAEHNRTKSSENLVRTDATVITAAQRAITCLRLSGRGDVMMGPMWLTRASRFDVGVGSGRSSGGWTLPSIGGSHYVLTRAFARQVRSLQPAVRYLEGHGYGRGPGNLDLALRSFISSYDRFPARQDSQLVDIVTAAEALLGSGTEITFKLAFRVAGMLGRTAEERLQVIRQHEGLLRRQEHDRARRHPEHGAACDAGPRGGGPRTRATPPGGLRSPGGLLIADEVHKELLQEGSGCGASRRAGKAAHASGAWNYRQVSSGPVFLTPGSERAWTARLAFMPSSCHRRPRPGPPHRARSWTSLPT